MSIGTTAQFLERAALAREAADHAVLKNVRQKHLDAAHAWEELAKPLKDRNPLVD